MGRNLRGRKPKQELGEKDGEATVGREGLRVREHNTRKLIAAVIFSPHFEGGWQWICSRKGFGLGESEEARI